jgi:AraC-like DNA-binding protein
METELASHPSDCRPDTLRYRQRAVERVILAMHERLSDPLSLRDMARIALMSPYHFNRVFGQITGIPPSRFLTALRLETAKRLLLTTNRSVTDICLDVGYNSLGSFITRFTELVGKSPVNLRRLGSKPVTGLDHVPCQESKTPPLGDTHGTVQGAVRGADSFEGRVFVGLFPAPIPQGHPVACTILSQCGHYIIERVPNGVYHVLVLALPRGGKAETHLLGDDTLRGHAGPLLVRAGRVAGPTQVTLRVARVTDPPVLVTLPFLMRGLCPTDPGGPTRQPAVGMAGGDGLEPSERAGVAGGAATNDTQRSLRVGEYQLMAGT